jgi:hypothetical protein
MNLLLYPNGQTVVQQMLEVNLPAFATYGENVVFMHLSKQTVGRIKPILGDKLVGEVECFVNDDMSYSQMTDTVISAINQIASIQYALELEENPKEGVTKTYGGANLRNKPIVIDQLTSVIGYITQNGIKEENLLVDSMRCLFDEHDETPINYLIKTPSPRVQVTHYLAICYLLTSGFVQVKRFNNVIDDPTQVKYKWAENITELHNYYYHKLANDNPLVTGHHFEYLAYPIPGIAKFVESVKHNNKKTQRTKSDNQKKYIFSVGLTDYTKSDPVGYTENGNLHRKDIISQLLASNINASEFFSVRYTSIDETLKRIHTQENDILPYADYLKQILYSKFTLIVPSYSQYVWSNKRFFEAILCDCLPFIYDPEGRRFEGLDFDYELISLVQELVVDSLDVSSMYAKCVSFPDARRWELLKSIKENNHFRLVTDLERVSIERTVAFTQDSYKNTPV